MKLQPVTSPTHVRLADRDARAPRGAPHGDALDAALAADEHRLSKLQRVFYADASHALLIVLQGRDAAGKDATIRRVFGSTNPQGCTVTGFKQPTSVELRHDYLWRVHQAVPQRGMIGIFNRSHYEDVVVVRVRRLADRRAWMQRYAQINAFERMLTQNGVVILKFFLHISREEQRRRLLERVTDPSKHWKLSLTDLEDRRLWPQYTRAYHDVLRACSTEWAPWYVVPADDHKVRDYLVARCIADTIEALQPRYPRVDAAVLRAARRALGAR